MIATIILVLFLFDVFTRGRHFTTLNSNVITIVVPRGNDGDIQESKSLFLSLPRGTLTLFLVTAGRRRYLPQRARLIKRGFAAVTGRPGEGFNLFSPSALMVAVETQHGIVPGV